MKPLDLRTKDGREYIQNWGKIYGVGERKQSEKWTDYRKRIIARINSSPITDKEFQ